MKPIKIDLSGLAEQFGLVANEIELLTEVCVNSTTALIYENWQTLAKRKLKSTAPEYLQNLIKVDKGRLEKQIVLIGKFPNMLEQGCSAFDMKEGFRKSSKVKYTIPVYNKKGNLIKEGGDWYLTIPFRIGVPRTLGQAGFSGQMPQSVYSIMKNMPTGKPLTIDVIPQPYGDRQKRQAVIGVKNQKFNVFEEYTHKNSIYEGMTKRTGVYGKTNQNTYGTFRRVGQKSDPMSWIHKGLIAANLAKQAVDISDVEGLVEEQVKTFLDLAL